MSVPIGGRKKKLKQSTAAKEAIVDYTIPPLVAMNSTATRYRNPTAAALTGTNRNRTNVIAATMKSDAQMRKLSEPSLRGRKPRIGLIPFRCLTELKAHAILLRTFIPRRETIFTLPIVPAPLDIA